MPGLLDQFGMRDHLAQQPDPRMMAIAQRQAQLNAQRMGIPYEMALQQALQRMQQAPRMPQGQPAGVQPQMPMGQAHGGWTRG